MTTRNFILILFLAAAQMGCQWEGPDKIQAIKAYGTAGGNPSHQDDPADSSPEEISIDDQQPEDPMTQYSKVYVDILENNCASCHFP